MDKVSKRIIIGIAIIAVIAIVLYVQSSKKAAETSGVTAAFAKCLGENAKMYGASWCPHCQAQKRMFGSNFQYITYIECDDNGKQAKVCTDAGIEGYPTWVFKNGEEASGELTVVDLSEKSGCSLDLLAQ